MKKLKTRSIKKNPDKRTPEKLYKDFTGREHDKISKEKILLPDEKTKVVHIGKAIEVVYGSDKKDGRYRLYEHPLKKHGKWLAVLGADNRVKTLIMTGINLKIDKRGLLG